MFSLRLPIPLENTITPLPPPKTNNPSPYSCFSRFHTHRFPSQPLTKLAIVPPNVAIRDEANDGTYVAGDSTESEQDPIPPELRPELMPKHVAVIMDGNGRWAKLRGLPPSDGHAAGVRSLRRLVRLCRSWGIKVLTVFAFSTDNLVRPKVEVDFLMRLFERTINSEIEALKRPSVEAVEHKEEDLNDNQEPNDCGYGCFWRFSVDQPWLCKSKGYKMRSASYGLGCEIDALSAEWRWDVLAANEEVPS